MTDHAALRELAEHHTRSSNWSTPDEARLARALLAALDVVEAVENVQGLESAMLSLGDEPASYGHRVAQESASENLADSRKNLLTALARFKEASDE